MKSLVIIGGGGHGKVVADIAKLCGYTDIKFLDDNDQINNCGGYRVVGKCSDYKLYSDECFFVAIGNAKSREQIQSELINVITLIHPSAVVANDAKVGRGTVIMAGAVVNSGSTIGDGCIINTCSSVDHDCHVGDYVHVSVGSHLCGSVTVDSGTWVGAGATVSNNIKICSDCTIGAGTVVIKDIKRTGTYVGVPAKMIGTLK